MYTPIRVRSGQCSCSAVELLYGPVRAHVYCMCCVYCGFINYHYWVKCQLMKVLTGRNSYICSCFGSLKWGGGLFRLEFDPGPSNVSCATTAVGIFHTRLWRKPLLIRRVAGYGRLLHIIFTLSLCTVQQQRSNVDVIDRQHTLSLIIVTFLTNPKSQV